MRHRVGARAIDFLIEGALTGIAAALAPDGRPVAIGVIAFLLVTAYEAGSIVRWGATPGKRATGLMVVAVDHEGPVPWRSALKRGAAIGSIALASFVLLPATFGVVLALYMLVSAATSSHHRAGHDRASDTFVVVAARRPRVVTTAQLDAWFDIRHARTWSSLGLVASVYDRRRARARRLEQAPWLLAFLVASSLVLVTVWQSFVAYLALTGAWIVVFAIDETIRIHRTGTTYGHREFGLVVIDRRTGRPPSWGRSTTRALMLGLFMFTPLVLILALWMKSADEGRGPHDRAAGTMVIVHPDVSEQFATWPVAPTAPLHRF